MEPTGTYGDSFRYHLVQSNIPVYQVGTVKSSRYSEIYDGVPSSHDAKSAAVVAHLHRDKKSTPWHVSTEDEKALLPGIVD